MRKTTTTTTFKYDADGKVIEKTVTEVVDEQTPALPAPGIPPWKPSTEPYDWRPRIYSGQQIISDPIRTVSFN